MVPSPDRSDAWPTFLELWDRLLSESRAPGTVIVVEGERDVRSLRRLGVDGPILPLHRGQRLGAVAHRLLGEARRVILLTDWDTEGGHLAHRLQELLAAGGVEVDLDLRRRLARCVRGEVVHVEGLYGWARRTAEREGAPLDHFRPIDPDRDPSDGVAPTG